LLFGIVLGVMFTFFFHIWMDYAWLTVTSYMISKGISILKAKFYNTLLFILSIVLALYGLYLIISNMAEATAFRMILNHLSQPILYRTMEF
jgi:hypothetical protein